MVEELFPSEVKIPGTNAVMNPNLARGIMLIRKRTADFFDSMKREQQAQYLVDENIASLQSDLEIYFLRSYTNGNGVGNLSTPNLIKCVGYVSSQGELKNRIQKDLFDSIGFEKLQTLEGFLNRYKD